MKNYVLTFTLTLLLSSLAFAGGQQEETGTIKLVFQRLLNTPRSML